MSENRLTDSRLASYDTSDSIVASGTVATQDVDLYPLRVTSTELCWLLDDSVSHPNDFYLRLRLTGQLDPEALSSAMRLAIDRNPMLSSVVVRDSKTSWYWVPSTSQYPTIKYMRRENGREFPFAERIDVSCDPGVRMTVVESSGFVDLVLQFDHAACDGVGASLFAADLLTAYSMTVFGDNGGQLRRLDPSALAQRDVIQPAIGATRRWISSEGVSPSILKRFYKNRPVALAPQRATHGRIAREDNPQSLVHRLSKQQSETILQTARKSNTTVNSLLLRHALTTIRDWRSARCSISEQELIRITVPMNLRGPEHRETSACNVVSLIYIDRHVRELRDEERLLRSINVEVKRCRRAGTGKVFPLAIEGLRERPDELARSVRDTRFGGTILVSNLGPALLHCDLPRRDGRICVGGLELESVTFLPSIRPGQGIVIGANYYAGRIELGLHFDSTLLTRTDVDEFGRRLIGSLTGK